MNWDTDVKDPKMLASSLHKLELDIRRIKNTLPFALRFSGWDGWFEDSVSWAADAAVANRFYFTGYTDERYRFPVGTKLWLNQTTDKYFYVVNAFLAYGTTFVDVTGGNDYGIVLSNTILNPRFSYLEDPQGFPTKFTWTPIWTGLTITGAPIHSGYFSISEKKLFYNSVINANGGTTSSAGGGVTYINNLPVSSGGTEGHNHTLDISTMADLGKGRIVNQSAYVQAWSARGDYITNQGWYFI